MTIEKKAEKEAEKSATKKRSLASLALVLSVAFHLVLALLLYLAPRIQLPVKPAHLSEVELIDAEKLVKQMQDDQTKGQIVDQNEKAVNDEVPKDSKYLSRHNQKVVEETQAQQHGKFVNSDTSGGAVAQQKILGKPAVKTGAVGKADKQAGEVKEEKSVMTDADGVAVKSHKPTLKDLMPDFKPGPPRVEDEQVAQGGGEGPSATDDHLKDVPKGMETLLSTREFVYFSYYNRIKEKLRQYWEPKIKEKMERIMRQGRTVASTGDKITRIIIILDENGVLQKIQVIGASGVTDLDDAAVEAFKAAAPFPNPPKGIVESDGTIKIRWDFILEADSTDFWGLIYARA
jgi:protein TonB